MKTVVLQTFRTHDVPPWLQRCMASVSGWARLHGFDYEFIDDRIFDLCGADYLARVGDNKRSITNLARLELVRLRLNEGYERAIWLDADVFVFAPERFVISLQRGYAFAKEVWLVVTPRGEVQTQVGAHNAALVFTRDQPDLAFMIDAIRYIVQTREISTNFQVGTALVRGLQRPLGMALLMNAGMFSPDTMRAIANDDAGLLAVLAREHGHRVYCANLTASLEHEIGEAVINRAMNLLQQDDGAIVNRYIPEDAGDGLTYSLEQASRTLHPHWRIDSPAWLLRRLVRQIAINVLPGSLVRRLRRSQHTAVGR